MTSDKKSNHDPKNLQKDLSEQNPKKNSKKHTSLLEPGIFIQGLPDDKVSTYISNRHQNEMFKPSMNMIIRILNSIIQEGAKTKTDLATDAKLHYSMLAKHVIWMEKKGLVKSKVENSKIKIDLTDKGKTFGLTIEKVME